MTGEAGRPDHRANQRRFIVETARSLAEREGWDALTTRRLAHEIRLSQPVIYKHFASMEAVVEAMALDGFGELTETLGEARRAAAPTDVLGAVASAYGRFATGNPALYDAMFTRATQLDFGLPQPVGVLRSAFDALREAVVTVGGEQDVDTLTEVLWAGLHGLATLSRSDRLRPGHDTDRTDLLVAQLRAAGSRTAARA